MNTPKSKAPVTPSITPDANAKNERSSSELDESDLKSVTGGAGGEIVITKTTDSSSPK